MHFRIFRSYLIQNTEVRISQGRAAAVGVPFTLKVNGNAAMASDTISKPRYDGEAHQFQIQYDSRIDKIKERIPKQRVCQ